MLKSFLKLFAVASKSILPFPAVLLLWCETNGLSSQKTWRQLSHVHRIPCSAASFCKSLHTCLLIIFLCVYHSFNMDLQASTRRCTYTSRVQILILHSISLPKEKSCGCTSELHVGALWRFQVCPVSSPAGKEVCCGW